jgi:hypothetical protein
LIAGFCALVLTTATLTADTFRIASMNTALERDGPGLLLRDILRDDPQVAAFANVVGQVAPDILVLQGIDYDHDLVTLTALRDRIEDRGGPAFPYLFSRRPNTGLATGLDMDGDGDLGRARDKQGYGRFAGQAGMAILSRYPFHNGGVQDFSALKWRDMPGAILPEKFGAPFPSTDAQAAQRLSSVAHWVVPVILPDDKPLHLLTFHAGPPVFDGPEDRNGRRNHDEIRFWRLFMDGAFGPAPQARFVLVGDANLDPVDGAGRKKAIRNLLADPRLQDPEPERLGPVSQEPGHLGDPKRDTVAWPHDGPGQLRVQYILPSVDLEVVDAGIHWPPADAPDAADVAAAGPHRMVWVDLTLP